MDLGADKRGKFRQSIRRNEIEEIKKSKRRMFEKEIKRMMQEQEQQKLYFRVINSSHEIFVEPQKYLQLLREALCWDRISNYKSLLAEVLLNVIKLYDQCPVAEAVLVLLIECVGMIFCETTIQFDQLTKRCLNICIQLFNKSKVGEGSEKLMRNRCLVAICNITSTSSRDILTLCEQMSLLQNLECFLQDFPVEDENKINILSTYGNIINFHLQYSYAQNENYISYFPFLLRQCVQQNYNSEVLAKATEAITNLLKIQAINKLDIVENMGCLYFNILSAGFYVDAAEDLLEVTAEYFATEAELEKQNFDVNQIFPKLYEILHLYENKYAQKIENSTALVKSSYWMAIISHKFYQQSEEQKLLDLTKGLCNFWIDLQDDTNVEFELYFLKFLRFALSNLKVLTDLYNQWDKEIEEDNAIRAPTWQIIVQYLKMVRIEGPQEIREFLHILQIENLFQMVPTQYQDSIYEKIEGCFYSQINDPQINILADRVLKNYRPQAK